MLALFPTPYPDELFYSMCARYHAWSRNPSIKHTVLDLFDDEKATAVVDLPFRLQTFYQQLPSESSKLKPYFIIDHHTLFPFYRPFLSKERIEKIIESMEGSVYVKNYKNEIMTSGIKPPSSFKFCIQCAKEDRDKFGEAYWHRTHQIAGVEVCPVHECWLVESGIPMRNRRGNQAYFCLDEETEYVEIDSNKKKHFSHYRMIAKDVYWLLNNNVPVLNLSQLKSRYRFYLKKMNFIEANTNLKLLKLTNAIERFYGNEFLALLNSSIPKNTKNYWLRYLCTNSKSNENLFVHPIRHILLMRFLGFSAEDFFNGDTDETSPFGKGPWLCFNAAASHYHQPVIDNCNVTKDKNTGDIIGIFSCSCGFVYQRMGPDNDENDRHQIGEIITYGPVWENEVKQLRTDRVPLEDIAKRLKISYYSLCNYLKRMDDSVDHPLEITTLDKKSIKQKRSSLIDWNQRDEELARKALLAAGEIRNLPGKPIKVTITMIANHIGKRGLLQNDIDKLPKTKEKIDQVTESVEEFQIRRIQWTANELFRNGEDVKRWKILNLCGLRGDLSKQVIDTVSSEVYKYSISSLKMPS
jgi:hypothetical protein